MIELVPLATVTYDVGEFVEIGMGPAGHRIVGEIAGATVEGERIRGSMRGTSGADWVTVGPGKVISIDVRWTLETDDGALIYVRYLGRSDGSHGLGASPSYCAPLFETGDDRYAWLNAIVAVGKAEFRGPQLVYEWYELR